MTLFSSYARAEQPTGSHWHPRYARLTDPAKPRYAGALKRAEARKRGTAKLNEWQRVKRMLREL